MYWIRISDTVILLHHFQEFVNSPILLSSNQIGGYLERVNCGANLALMILQIRVENEGLEAKTRVSTKQ